MMKIQEGQVKYKDRTDIKCTYGVTDDGRQYYFLDSEDRKLFKNNARIASTDLKEAIDPMAPSSKIGLIGEDGNEIIPFTNKSIRPVNEDIVLAEASEPISDNVKEAVQLKQDPLSATKLVSTPALIKDKINKKMGSDGRYLFNDQFSEATAFDVNGNNLWGNNYYSFIATDGNRMYFSKNTLDSDVSEYSMLPPEVQSDVTPNSDTNEIDVTNVAVDNTVVENALSNGNVNEGFASNEIAPVALSEDQMVQEQSEAAAPVDVTPIAPVDETVVAEAPVDEFAMPTIDADEETVEETNEEVTPTEEVAPVENVVTEEVAPVENIVTEEVAPIENTEIPVDEIVENPVDEVEETVEEVNDSDLDVNEETESTTLDNMFNQVNDAVDVESDMNEDIFKDSIVETDSIDVEDEFEDSNYEDSPIKDTTMAEVAKSMAGLIKQNRELKQTRDDLTDRYERLSSSRKTVVEKNKMLEEKLSAINTKNQSLDNKVIKLESRNDILESRVHDQERVIESQRRELDNLRAQLEGKEELSRLLQDAKVMLEDGNSSYEYENEDNYYRMAA